MRSFFIDPGRLRTELALEAPAGAPDGLGGFAETWNEVGLVFALVEPISAQSVFGADQTLESVTHRIHVQWRDDLASGMRFRMGGRVFDVVTVHDPDGTARYLVCRAKETGS